MRKLDPDERSLWQQVAATVRPLGDPGSAPKKDTRQYYDIAVGPRRERPVPERPLVERGRLRDGNLDGHWERRIRSGEIVPDRSLDLHGMSLDQAWNAIDRLLERAIGSGERIVLLITGRDRPEGEWTGSGRPGRGRIRRLVHDWLAGSRHSESIAAVRTAHRKHGGAGSLYLILRRR